MEGEVVTPFCGQGAEDEFDEGDCCQSQPSNPSPSKSTQRQQNFIPIQTRRFRRPITCWSLCPSMDLVALGSGSPNGIDVNKEAGSAGVGADTAEAVAVHRIVSWQRLLTLSLEELTSFPEDEENEYLDGPLTEFDDWALSGNSGELHCSSSLSRRDKLTTSSSLELSLEQKAHDERIKLKGATSICWSPDGRFVGIGLSDGGVLVHTVEPNAKADADAGEPAVKRSIHIIRTPIPEIFRSSVEDDLKRNSHNAAVAFSPRVTRAMAARREKNDECGEADYVHLKTTKCEYIPSKLEIDSTSFAVIGLAWKRVFLCQTYREHGGAECEARDSWRYLSQLIGRGQLFLPPESYAYHDDAPTFVAEKSGASLFSPLAHLNVLCVCTRRDLHLYLQGRYRILTHSLNLRKDLPAVSVSVVCSPDLSLVLCVSEHESSKMPKKTVFSSEIRVFSCPLLASKRYDLQIISASYRSLSFRLKSINQGIQSALVTWRTALRPLDIKFRGLFDLLCKYGTCNSDFEVGSAAHLIRMELLRFVVSGRSTVMGDASNALDQFFTRPWMHDQLFQREARGIDVNVGSLESILRSTIQSEVRAIVYDTEELYGLVRARGLNSGNLNLVDPHMALGLLSSSRCLFVTFERLISHMVEARSRLHDFLAWMRAAASQIRAQGTATDSIQRQHARDRRCPNGIVCRVVSFLSSPCMSPYQDSPEMTLDHRNLTECIIGVPISDFLEDCFVDSREQNDIGLSKEGRTVKSALLNTFCMCASVFRQPRNVCSRFLSEQVVVFDINHSLIAIHTRSAMKLRCDSSSVCERVDEIPYWVIVVRTIASQRFGEVLEITALPSVVLDVPGEDNELVPTDWARHLCFQAHLTIPDEHEVGAISFYSDERNISSTQVTGVYGETKEERQSLGLLVKRKCGGNVNEELWKFQYDGVLFEPFSVKRYDSQVWISSNVPEQNRSILDYCSDLEFARGDLKKRVLSTQKSEVECLQSSRMHLCGSRGTGGVVTHGPSNKLEILDLEEDEDDDKANNEYSSEDE